MIRNQWYAVLASGQVKKGRPVGVTRLGDRLVFWRDSAGQLSCLRDQCPHFGAALSAGVVCGDQLRCPFHGFEYDSSGQCRLIPANGRSAKVSPRVRVAGFPVREAHDFIYICWGDERQHLPPVPFFADIDETAFSHATICDPWQVHYSRAIENQRDVMHLPFVHHNTIGRGHRTLVDGPLVRWQNDDLMFVYVFNRADDGTPAAHPVVLTPRGSFRLEFQFPNLWQNHLSDAARLPVLCSVANWAAMPFNRVILHQDRRVVQTQRPKRSDLRMGESLVQGDRPIVEYWRRRRALENALREPRFQHLHVVRLTSPRQAERWLANIGA